MFKKLFLLVLIITISSCTTTAEKEEIKEQESFISTMNDFREQGITQIELDNIILASEFTMPNPKFNVYISGELKTVQVMLDICNSQINKLETSLLIPIKILNKSNQELYLNRLTDKLFLIFKRPTGDESSQLFLLAIPYKIFPNNESTFIAIYNFKNDEERVGFEVTLQLLKDYINNLNLTDRPLNKKEMSDLNEHEKGMQKIWKGKFDIETSGISIPLSYKIIQKTE